MNAAHVVELLAMFDALPCIDPYLTDVAAASNIYFHVARRCTKMHTDAQGIRTHRKNSRIDQNRFQLQMFIVHLSNFEML